MRKILIINTIGFGYEGISSVILNYLENMDISDMNIAIAVNSETELNARKRIAAIAHIIEFPIRKKNVFSYIKILRRTLKREKYDVVHIHGNSGTMAIETFLCKFSNIKKIIVHVHNTTCNHPIMNKIMRRPMSILATDCLACSEEAGKWLYGNRKYIVLNNAININKFLFDEKIRNEVRKEMNIKDRFVIGHVGNYLEQKNHSFLIDIFYDYRRMNSNACLLLIGDGPKYEEIKEKVSRLNIDKFVIFMGSISNPNRIYQAMDLFILPSLWEGLPVAMLEAQANGLPVIASDVITKDAKCLNSTEFVTLSSDTSRWTSLIDSYHKNGCPRNRNVSEEFRSHGFDIQKEANKLREIYLK